jgi:hypothetical protein
MAKFTKRVVEFIDVAEMLEASQDVRLKELLEKGETKFNVSIESEYREFDDQALTITHFISTEDEDRVGDIVRADGGDATDFMRNPVVLFGHDDYSFPIGKCLWLKVTTKTNAQGMAVKGILVKTQFEDVSGSANAPSVGRTCYELWKGGFLNASSIRLRPKKDGYIPRMDDNGNWIGIEFTKWFLFEYSIVDIPCNQEALRNALGKGQYTNDDVRKKLMDALNKGAIAYHKYPKADESAAWDAGAETKKATLDDLKKMCAWYDTANADKKSAYKLQHHQVDKFATVWGGVKAAMGALLGARGGIKIPDADREKVFAHLSKHYKEFGKTPPELKSYTEDELVKMFPEAYKVVLLYDDVEAKIHIDGLIFDRDFFHSLGQTLGLAPIALMKKEDVVQWFKAGAVISQDNAEKLQMSHDMVADVMDSSGRDVCAGYGGNPDEPGENEDDDANSPRVGDHADEVDEEQSGKSFFKRLKRMEKMLAAMKTNVEIKLNPTIVNGTDLVLALESAHVVMTEEQKQLILKAKPDAQPTPAKTVADASPNQDQDHKSVPITVDKDEYLAGATRRALDLVKGKIV